MRLATARDEIDPLRDPAVRDNEAYLGVLLLARVITRIGTVTDLALNIETYRADATFAIDEAVRLPDDSSAAVATEGLLGGTFIDVQPGGSPFNLDAGGEIVDTQSAVSLVTLLLRFVTGSEE